MLRSAFHFALLILSPLSLFAGESPVPAQFQYPLAVAVAEDEVIYVADRKLPGIWKISDGKFKVYYQASKRFGTPLNAVRCLAIAKNGQLLAGDSATREVYRFDKTGEPKPLTNGKIGIPSAIAPDNQGTLFVADLETQRIWKVPATGGKPKEFLVTAGVRGLSFDSKGNLIVIRNLSDQVKRVSPDGRVEVLVKKRPMKFPHHVVINKKDEMFVADNYLGGIWKISPGQPPKVFASGKPLMKPVGLARQGKLLIVADPHAKKLFSIDKDGKVATLAK